LDAYRLESAAQFQELGVEEMFQQPGLVVIEWGDRVRACLPEGHFQLELEITGSTSRAVTLRGPAHVPDH
jgi:tRNA threonylcarbamoyladenosine biosynthesis protein TsaE